MVNLSDLITTTQAEGADLILKYIKIILKGFRSHIKSQAVDFLILRLVRIQGEIQKRVAIIVGKGEIPI